MGVAHKVGEIRFGSLFLGCASAGFAGWWVWKMGYPVIVMSVLCCTAILIEVVVHLLEKRLPEVLVEKCVLYFGSFAYSAVVLTLVGGLHHLVYSLPAAGLNWLAVLVFPGGCLAARLKRRNQHQYGRVEIAVGVLTALSTINSGTKFEPIQLLTIIGALYVVARGFGNIYEAEAKSEKEARRAERRLKKLEWRPINSSRSARPDIPAVRGDSNGMSELQRLNA